MKDIKIVKHGKGAKGLRFFGIGPNLRPSKGLIKLKELFDNETFWARGRNLKGLKIMLSYSTVVITVWDKNRLIGFGRATSDYCYRGVLWDIIVAKEKKGIGIGSLIIETLIQSPEINNLEKIYLMTTHCSEFYKQKGFKVNQNQTLLYITQEPKIK